MMYIRDLAAIARLTLIVAGSLPMAAKLKGNTLLGAECQTGTEPDPAVWKSCGHMLNTGAPPQPCVCSVVRDLTLADDAGTDSAFL
jgi:hypothetical protein